MIHSDFHVPKRHRLLDELTLRRRDITELLELPTSDEPINVFLFKNELRFLEFMRANHPRFPNRRAFFVKNDTTLQIYAYWGERVGEDLRHEVTHGYLHSVVPNMPLWLDEGLAEFFEVPRGKRGFNRPHVYLLANLFRHDKWEPDLTRLEQITAPDKLTQQDYAESWLWVHFLLEKGGDYRQIIRQQLSQLQDEGTAGPVSEQINRQFGDVKKDLLEHLRNLAEKM